MRILEWFMDDAMNSPACFVLFIWALGLLIVGLFALIDALLRTI